MIRRRKVKFSTVKRMIAPLLTVLMLLGLAACAKPNTSDETTPAAAETVIDPSTTEELYLGYKKDDIPDTLKYNKETVKILYWSNAERPEFEIEEDADDSDRIISAIKMRNAAVQDRLDVVFEWDGQKGAVGQRADFTKYVETQYNGSNYYDIIAAYSRVAGMLSTRGFLVDINTIDDNHINFEQDWWPKTVIDTCTIGQSLYFISGDISTNTLHFMYGIYYNKELISSYNLDEPSTLVQNGTWTISKLIDMTRDKYQDLNSNESADKEDFFGFCTVNFHCDAFYTGSNLMLVEQDPDKTLIISPDFSGEKAINLVAQLGTWLPTKDCIVNSGTYQVPFVSGQALFCQNRVYMADAINKCGLNAVTWKYGIVPTPKYDEDQDEYITVMGNPFTLYGIGNGSSNYSRATAVLECWASEAYRRTTPAIFEVNMKLRYAKDNIDSQMFDILRATCRYDLGRIFSDDLSFMSEMPSKAACAGTPWSAGLKSKVKILNNSIAGIVSDLEKNAKLVK